MVKFKPPQDEKLDPCAKCKKRCNASPFMNMDDPHKNWFHPNTMGKMRKQPDYDRREEKKGKKG